MKNIILDDDRLQNLSKLRDLFHITPAIKLIGNSWIADLQNEFMSAKLSEIEAKFVLLPYKDKQIALPFTDSVW